EKVILWVNPQETYNFYSVSFYRQDGHAQATHKWGGLENVDKTTVRELELDDSKAMQFKQAIENNYWFELFMGMHCVF
ncbi:hypothetical protein M8C21_005751, partial [Ambrosia artemisiifolia]